MPTVLRSKQSFGLPSAPARSGGRRFGFITSLMIAPTLAAQPLDSSQLVELSLEELMNIEITSVFRRPEKLLDSPAAIQVITRDQIRRSGATNIPEALRLASNLQVAQQNAHEWIISARGFSSDVGNKLLVLMDGRTLYTPLFSGVFWDRQDYLLEDIERIEVISGPGGTLWGANAVNGVINIITRDAADSAGLFLQAGGGDALESFAGLRYGGQLGDKKAYRIYGKAAERDDYYLSDGSSGRDAWRMAQSGFRIDAQASARDNLTLQGDYYRNENSLLSGDASKSWGANLLGRWVRNYDENANTQLQLYYDVTDLRLPTAAVVINNTPLAPAGVFRDRLETLDIDFQHQFGWGSRQTLIWGLGYRRTDDQVENSSALAFYPATLEQELFSGFIQDEISLIPERLKLTLGTKLEHNDYTGEEWEPSIRLQWQPTPRQMVWGALSQAVRMPSRIDREISLPAQPYLVILRGDADFSSEKVHAYELGYRLQYQDKLMLSVSSFYNRYDDLRSTSLTPGTILPFFFANNLEGYTYGAELSLQLQATDWWQLRGGYNYLEQVLRVKDGAFDFNNAYNETADPKHQLSLQSSMALGRQFELDLGWRWVDKLPTNNAGTLVFVPAYAELDLRLGWRPNEQLELALVGQNLLHKHHQEFGIPGPGQEEIGRNLHLRFRLNF